MDIAITKGCGEDRIAIVRADGSRAETAFPHKGPVPHDAVHFFVERGLGLKRAFWGLVAAGRHPEELAALAKAGGHASATRATEPEVGIVGLIQAERLVECFEAEMWSGGADDGGLLEMAAGGCATSHVAVPVIAPGALARTRAALIAFARDWPTAPIGHTVTLKWEEN